MGGNGWVTNGNGWETNGNEWGKPMVMDGRQW